MLLVVPAALFALLWWEVHRAHVPGWDGFGLRHLHPLAGVGPVHTLLRLSFVAAGNVAVPVVLVVAVTWLLRRGLRREAVFLLAAVGSSAGLAFVLKRIVRRPPIAAYQYGWSFPSGHATTALALALALALVLRARWTVIGGAVYVALVGVAAVALRYHYPSDVVAGWCVAAVCVGGIRSITRSFGSAKPTWR